MRIPYLLMVFCLSIIPIGCGGCAPTPNYWTDAKPGQKKVLVSFPPLYAITQAVAGDDAYVLCMLTTQGPHGYEGSLTDVHMVNHADLFIYNGLTLDDEFVRKMLRGHSNDALAKLNVGTTMMGQDPALIRKGDGQWHFMPDGSKHKHGDEDPHYWLGPTQAIAMTKIIAEKLSEVDPSHKAAYDKRAAKFIGELTELENHGNAAFKNKKSKKFITMHESFAYFAKAFKLNIVAPIQSKPGEDPDAKTIANLVELCREPDGPRVIAVEPQYSDAQAKSLQRGLAQEGIEVQIVTLDPLETTEMAKGQKFNPDPGYYLKKMRENIDTLARALP